MFDQRVMMKVVKLTVCLVFLSSLVASQRAQYIQLNEETWRDLLTGEWMVSLYAPWCPACKSLKPQWDRFAGWMEDLNIKVAAIDVTENPGLSGRFMVTALPTIYHVKDGEFRAYRGSRDSDAFVSFIEDKKWKTAEILSKWKYPDSIQMSLVSHFFRISMALRTVHNHLVEDYGVPYWGSYIIFAFATVLLGALLGLLIVCIIDIIFPAKASDLHLDIDSRKSSLSEKDIGDIPEDEAKSNETPSTTATTTENTDNTDTQLRKRVKKKNNDEDEDDEEDEDAAAAAGGDEEAEQEDKVQVKEIETKKET